MRFQWMTSLTASALAALLSTAAPDASAQLAPEAAVMAPTSNYRYDSSWPKPLPHTWAIGGITGMFVDARDRIWVLNRPRDLNATDNYLTLKPAAADCCIAAPAVLVFDADGNLLRSWGVPGSVPGWPESEHTIFLDGAGNVWVGGARPGDSLLKFTEDGKFISDWGHRGPKVPIEGQKQDNQQTDLLLRGVAAAALDEGEREIYIADGYLNRRVMVYDVDTGAFKRGWGAYGKALSTVPNNEDPPYRPGVLAPDFKAPVHCVGLSRDGLVYVCDRASSRIQVFSKQGKFVKEFTIAPQTLMRGTAGSIDFSHDRAQRYLFVSDIMNMTVWKLERDSGRVVDRIARAGHAGGELTLPHIAVVDSKGNIYTGEVGPGPRLQKFKPRR